VSLPRLGWARVFPLHSAVETPNVSVGIFGVFVLCLTFILVCLAAWCVFMEINCVQTTRVAGKISPLRIALRGRKPLRCDNRHGSVNLIELSSTFLNQITCSTLFSVWISSVGLIDIN
jgi:hypothetical protein